MPWLRVHKYWVVPSRGGTPRLEQLRVTPGTKSPSPGFYGEQGVSLVTLEPARGLCMVCMVHNQPWEELACS